MLKGGEEGYEGDARCLACKKVSKYHASFSGCPYCGHVIMEPADLNSEEEALEHIPREAVEWGLRVIEYARKAPHLSSREVMLRVAREMDAEYRAKLEADKAAQLAKQEPQEPQGENPGDASKPDHPAPPEAGGEPPAETIEF